MTKYENLKFENEEIVLDNSEFINCTFIDCIFRYSGGDCSFTGGDFKNFGFRFIGSAQKTVTILRMFGLIQMTPIAAVDENSPMRTSSVDGIRLGVSP